MNNLNLYFTILSISISIVLLFLLIKKNRQLKKSNDERYHLLEKYRGIMSVKTELKKLNKQKENIESNINNLKTDFEERNLFIDNIEEIEKYIDLLQNEYRKKQIYYERITKIEEYIYEKELEKQKQDNEILELEKKTNRLRVDFETKKLSYVSLESIEKEISLKKEEEKAVTREIENLRDLYKTKKLTYDNLIKEISILEEDLEDLSYGLYKPHFEFDSPEGYKSKITEIKEEQRNAIRNKKAAKCNTNWEVNESKREGTKLTNRNIKLMLRAFNGECDSAVLKVRWNNVLTLEERIKKSFELINKLGETSSITIENSYLQLKLDELRLAHEYKEKKHEEREKQRRVQRQIREEQKVLREIELAKKEAEKEEQKYIELLAKAKQEVLNKHGLELDRYNERIKQLETELEKTRELKERAISRAQITKSGNVYIISNLGAFGENVYKIGMTRRLEPFDRVYELSGASVPFSYDVHGMIYSEDAPKLENELHKRFDKKRVNRVNYRKEFFKVSLEEIENELKTIDEDIELIKLPEARQFRETLLLDSEENKENIDNLLKMFPDEI